MKFFKSGATIAVAIAAVAALTLSGASAGTDHQIRTYEIHHNAVHSSDINNGAVHQPDLSPRVRALLHQHAKDGKNGKRGHVGEKGEHGSAGQNGKDGVDGQPGAAGQNGKDGVDGEVDYTLVNSYIDSVIAQQGYVTQNDLTALQSYLDGTGSGDIWTYAKNVQQNVRYTQKEIDNMTAQLNALPTTSTSGVTSNDVTQLIESYLAAHPVVGEQGPKGDTGAPGPQGPQGEQGPAGPAADVSGLQAQINDLQNQIDGLKHCAQNGNCNR